MNAKDSIRDEIAALKVRINDLRKQHDNLNLQLQRLEDPELWVNIDAFFGMLPDLLAEGLRDQYILLFDGKRIGIYPSFETVLAAGYEKYGRGSFIVQKIEELRVARGLEW